MIDIIKDGGFVLISEKRRKLMRHMVKGEVHHKSLAFSKYVGDVEYFLQYRNQAGMILLVPVE